MKNVVLLLLLISSFCHAQTTYEDYCRNGNRLCAKGKYGEAVENYKVAIKLDSMNGTAYQGCALAEDKMGNYMAAIRSYTWYIALSKDSAMGCIWRAEIEKNIRNYSQALADCDASLRHRPGFTHAYGLRGDVKFGLKDYKGAVADYDTVLMADAVVLYKYYFHRAAVKYILMNYAGGTADKRRGEYFARFPHEGASADAAHRQSAKGKPASGGTHAAEARGQSAKEGSQRISTEPLFMNKWLNGYERDSILTQLKLSKAIALEPNKGPLYAARGLIALRQGRADDACIDFTRAKEMGYKEAGEMLKAYCR